MGKNPFVTVDGKVINNLKDLYLTLSDIDESIYNQHVDESKNDFSDWLNYMNFPQMADSIKTASTRDDALEIMRRFGGFMDEHEGPQPKFSCEGEVENLKEDDQEFSQSGIYELDNILNGGIPYNSVVLLSGKAGTGKTTLAMQWLYNGANKYDEPGVYFSLTESKKKILKNKSKFVFSESSKLPVYIGDLRSVFRFIHVGDKKISDEHVEEILHSIESIVKKNKAKRLVIDSISALCYFLQDKSRIRNFVYLLSNVLNQLDCTTILTSEMNNSMLSEFGFEEYMCDGIIKLEQMQVKDKFLRNIQIVKMKGLRYEPEVFKFSIDRTGICILPKIKPELNFASHDTFIRSGIAGMDDMLGKGIFRGSTTLLSGAAGTGKSLLSMQFLFEGLKEKEKVLLFSFEESGEQIIRNAKNIGLDVKKYIEDGSFHLVSMYPDKYELEEYMLIIARIVEKHKIKRCVVDSISALSFIFPHDELNNFFRNLNMYLKSRFVSSMVTCTALVEERYPVTEFHISSTTDNIIILKFVEIESEMKRMIGVLKTRGTDHDKKLREYVINNKGIGVKGAFKDVVGVFSGKASKKPDKKLIKAMEKLEKKS